MTAHPVTYVYVHAIEANGAENLYRYVAVGDTEDDVKQAVRDATKFLGAHFVRLVEVYTVEPRVFDLKPEVVER